MLQSPTFKQKDVHNSFKKITVTEQVVTPCNNINAFALKKYCILMSVDVRTNIMPEASSLHRQKKLPPFHWKQTLVWAPL